MRRVLLCVAVLFVLVRSATGPEDANAESLRRCEDIGKAPRDQRCDLVKVLCDKESREGTLSLDYLSTYYCHVEGHTFPLQLLFWTLLCLLGVVLFSLLGDTAEKYFSPALTQICQQVPKMRPRFAGVTVLAFANGAPDLSATVNAIRTCKFDLSLGALTGAGMFVNCFVAGWIILLSNGAKCRGATIRDVATYFLTIFGVLIALSVHRVGVAAVVLAFLLYGVFVLVVFTADEWHEQGRPDFWSKPLGRVAAGLRWEAEREEEMLMHRTEPVWATYEEGRDADVGENDQLQRLLVSTARVREEDSAEMPTIWAQLSPQRYRQQALAEMAGSDDDLYDYPLDHDLLREGPLAEPPVAQEPSPSRSSSPRPLSQSVVPFETEHASPSRPPTGIFGQYPWLQPVWESFLMDDLPKEEGSFWTQAFLVLRLPFMLLQRATIPLTSQEHFSSFWLVTAIGLSPLMWLVYFNLSNWVSAVVAVLSGALLAGMTFLALKGLTSPPVWSFGTSWPIGASVVAIYGLVVGIFWIDILAGELVDLLYCAGTVTGIPSAVLGLTVLAWGNSIGDFFTNTSIARAGKGNMALTACYAGPVFNMLMGLGMGFLSFFAAQSRSTAQIHVGPQVVLGCICLLVHAVGVVFVGVRKGFRLPQRFGYFSIAVYVLYLTIAVSLQFLLDEGVRAVAEGSALEQMTVLVAGPTGGTGTEIVKQLTNGGATVRAIARDAVKAKERLPTAVQIYRADVLDRPSLEDPVANVDAVVCALGPRNFLNPLEPYLVDLQGAGNLIAAAERAAVRKFVLVSSIGVDIDNPLFRIAFWGVLYFKKAGEERLRQSGLDYTIVRPAGLRDGAKEGLENANVTMVAAGERTFSGSILRSDVAACCIAALTESAASNKIVEIVAENAAPSRSWKELFESVL